MFLVHVVYSAYANAEILEHWPASQRYFSTFETTWRTDRAEELMPSLPPPAGPTSGGPKIFSRDTEEQVDFGMDCFGHR